MAEVILAVATVLLALATCALAWQAREEAKAAGRLADQAAKQAEATKVAMFVQGALSLFGELEKPKTRGERRKIYREATHKNPEEIARDPKVGEVVERVAATFDYLGRLANVDDRLRDLAIEFYGVPTVRCWAITKPYVTYMIDSGRRNPNFHEAFRNFAETAASDPRVGEQPGINYGHRVHIDVREGIIEVLGIWDEKGEGVGERAEEEYRDESQKP